MASHLELVRVASPPSIPLEMTADMRKFVGIGNMKPRAESLTAESVKLPSSRQALNPKGRA